MSAIAFNLPLVILSFFAALLNGAIGYGFSSTVTPIALFYVTNKALNPALVLVELGVNVTLLVRERRYITETWSRAWPVIAGLLPGVLVGTTALVLVNSTIVRLVVYVVLLPLVILQLFGIRRVIRRERTVSPPFGSALGLLYSLTTISGPPMALFWRNQGLSKNDFRCVLAQIRVAEAGLTTGTYLAFGLFTPTSLSLVPSLGLPVLVAVPLGTMLLGRFSRDFFRLFVMAADGTFVAYGLNAVLTKLKWLSAFNGDLMVLGVLFLLGILLYLALRKLPSVWANKADASTPGSPRVPEQFPPRAGPIPEK